MALAAKKEDAEAREGRLREVVAALGLDPALALAGDPDETISLDEAAVEGGAQTPAAGSEPMASAPGAQRTERGGTAPFAGAHPAEAVEAALAEQARMAEARRALEALDETRRAQALERVDDLLSGSPTLRHAAIQSLVRLAGPAATPLFSAALSWIHDPEERSALLRAVGEAGGEGALETLEAALRDENPRLRAAAAEALACLDDPRSLGLLVALLGDPAATVRRRAALAVAASGRPEAPELMARAARDEDPQLRRIACTALGTLDHPLARRALLTALNDRRLEVRRAAAAALGRQLGRDLSHLPDLPEAERRRAVTALRDRGAQEKRSGPAEDSSAQPSPSSEAPTDLRPNPSPASNPEPRRQPASTRPAGEEGVRGSSAPGFEAVRRALEISLRPLSLDELHAAVGGERGALAVLVQQRLAAGELMRRGHKFSLP
ncbi:MAG: HEAT repeat domain-containing protein [Deltaproteobacteria bacterium]|nr:MAG: HEAT repeat domain-containing protein [Deltaproteobacteria bacterium]